jgi:hypothetical protein
VQGKLKISWFRKKNKVKKVNDNRSSCRQSTAKTERWASRVSCSYQEELEEKAKGNSDQV